MQTTPLPSMISGANVNNAPQRAASDNGGSQFSAALSREISHRSQAPTPAPAVAPQQQGASRAAARQESKQPAAQQQAAQPDDEQDAAAAANASGATQAGSTQASGDAADDEATGAADAAAQGASPITDMLALVASFNQMLRPAAVATEAAQAGAAGANAEGLPQLAARLQASLPDAAAASGAAAGEAGGDVAARFAALMRSGQRAAQPGADSPLATAAPRAPASGASDTSTIQPGAADDKLAAQADLSSSHAASSAAGVSPSAAPSAAPSSAPLALEADLKQLAAAVQRADAAHDQPAAQLLAASQVQQAAPVVAQAVAASEYIGARVGTPNWDNQVGQKIVWMVAGGEQTASLTLNPPDLGPMQVVLSVNGDQASVAFSANQQEVRNALENALPRLREMMSESGIALGSATVSTGMPDQRQAQGEWNGSNGSGARGNGGAAVADDAQAPRVASRTTILGDRGMVDTFA